MTIGITPIDQKVYAVTQCNETSPLEILQAAEIYCSRQNNTYSVANLAALPPAADNTGRFVFVEDRCAYRYSDGAEWTNNFTSEPASPNAYAWGANSSGRLGDNTVVNQSSPVLVVGGFINWRQVDAGCCFSIGLRANGTAWTWGSNNNGQLGDGTCINKSSPVSIVGGFTDWCQVSAGCAHSLGVRTNGSMWAWGANGAGQLADGTVNVRSSPVSVIGGFTNWCQVSAGVNHNLALRTNGTAWAWGTNGTGRLGDGTDIARCSPVSVVGGFTDWRQVSAGSSHSLGIRTNGTAWAWGSNSLGRLGDNTVVDKSSPVSVVGGFTDWCQVSAGEFNSFGIRCNGTLWAWGFNTCGRLGDNTVVNRSSPVSVVGGFTDWCGVSADHGHAVAVRTNGTAWAWGYNNVGQLGDNTLVSRSSPVLVAGDFTNWCQVSAGREHSLAVRALVR